MMSLSKQQEMTTRNQLIAGYGAEDIAVQLATADLERAVADQAQIYVPVVRAYIKSLRSLWFFEKWRER